MFRNVEDAIELLSGLAEDTLITAIVSLAMPVVILGPQDQPDPRSLTFIGGAPVWSAMQEWPKPPRPDDIDEISGRGGEAHGPAIKESLVAQIPYSFVGQIDLQTLDVPGLPTTGRLHFFYDIATGPWDTSTRSAHVNWDQTPAADLVEASTPTVLLAAEAKQKELASQPVELDDQMLSILRQSGLSEAEIANIQADMASPSDDPGNYLIGPKRALLPTPALQLPVWSNLEWEGFLDQVSKASGRPLDSDVLGEIIDGAEIKIEARQHFEAPGFLGRTFQVGGLPYPEQDDPRLSAAIVTVLGKQFLEDGDWDRHKPALYDAAYDMQLLFQVSVADWLETNGEGTVYFLITKQDLEARKFDNVIAVYQQT